MKFSVRTMAAASLLAVMMIGVAGCSGTSSKASGATSTTAAATTSCKFEYQAAAGRLNGVARNFSQAAQNGQMTQQFAGFAANYVAAMKVFDTAVSALDCSAEIKADLANLVTAQAQLEPLVAQFAAGARPSISEFNAASQAVADAVRRVNATLGIY